MAHFESGRRLCLLFEAGDVRYAIEATSVVEVAPPDLDGESIRGFLGLRDLSQLLGGPALSELGMAVVLDVSPTLAIRVSRVIEVADVARDTLFRLPQGLSEGLSVVVRAAIAHAGHLYLELAADALPNAEGQASPSKALRWASAPRPVYAAEQAPERALVFESQGRLYGIGLGFVSQVASATEAFCTLPAAGGPIAGLFPLEQTLWPIYTAPGLLGGIAKREEFFILADLAGHHVGLTATRVLGVHQHFTATDVRGEFAAPGLATPALFLDLQRMFS